MSASEPMIKLDPSGQAPVLSYNVPEPTSYAGRNFIDLGLPSDWFVEVEVPKEDPVKGLSHAELSEQIADSIAISTSSPIRRRLVVPKTLSKGITRTAKPRPTGRSRTAAASEATPANTANLPFAEAANVSADLATLSSDTIATNMQAGNSLVVYESMYGNYTYTFVPEPEVPEPKLMLVEKVRLSSFLGNYGAGRTIKTFSLLPGESTKISVKSYTRSSTTAANASSIFDSFTETSANEFSESVQSEQSNSESYEQSKSYYVDAEASGSWGFGKASVSGGTEGSSNSAREEFAKNISSASESSAMSASAQRDVEINTSYEVSTETGEETSTEREIKNINVSRTLNFVFRQLNQEHISLLHLLDVRIGYTTGLTGGYREVPISDLDSLLQDVVVQGKQTKVKNAILNELKLILDYQSNPHAFVEEKKIKDTSGAAKFSYWRTKTEMTSTYSDPATGSTFTVSGIILNAQKNTLRTEAVIVDAILGQGDALDAYSHALQDETVREKRVANDMAAALKDRETLAQKLVTSKDSAAAAVFAQVFPAPESGEEV